VNIRYKGGPLNRRQANSNAPSHRDADGHPIALRIAQDLIQGHARLGSTAPVYFLGPDKRTYVWLRDLVAGRRTQRIKELIEHAEQHPEDAARVEAQIRELEAAG
jgi:hypothetical protein